MAEQSAAPLIRKAAWLALAMLLLMACSVASVLMLDGWLAVAVPMAVAVLTACIVGLAFMEVQKADVVSQISAGVAVAFLGILFALTFADELTRAHIPPTFEGTEE